VSWLYYANRLYELPLGVASIVISAVLAPRIAAAILDGNSAGAARAQSHALEIGLALVLPAAAGFAVLAHPIAMGLFERGAFGAADSVAVAAALAAICAGLPGHVTEKVMGGIAFAHEDTRTPMLVALAGLALVIVIGIALFPTYGATGIAAAIAVSGWFDALLLAVILARRGWLTLDPATPARLVRIVAATAVMALAVAGATAALAASIRPGWRALAITLLLTTGGALLYGGLLHALRVVDLRTLRHGWR
jgi:putative peptidoglycan lipid II flippase